ncbi:hypothetical protein ACTFJW_02125 [Clostridium cagae]
MVNVNFIACILYIILSIGNMLGYISIDNSEVFGMTLGTLFLCIAPLFSQKQEKIKFLNYLLAIMFVVGFHLFKDSAIIAENSETNTWLLLSLAVTFLSNYFNELNRKSNEIEKRNAQLKKEKEQIEKLKKEV